jgi:nitrous oxidase accessory protein NosD
LDSNHNKLTGNVMVDNGLYISSYFIWDSVFHTNEIDKNNTVNGKPVYYWKNIEGGRIPAGAGQVILVNCTNICIENQNLNNATNNNSILNNNCSNNEYAIYLEWSNNNFIYLNNFINNRKGVYYTGSENIWNSTEKITYTYNGSTHSNSLGNYWADYTGNDTNDDEIGETPYRINSDKDNYPLMLPWQNYIPEETRAAENKKKALPKE